MPVKVMQRPELTFWEKLYIPQIVDGLRITSWHFFRNMFFHTAHLFGLFKDIPAAVTFQYPEILRPLAMRFRGRHRLTVRLTRDLYNHIIVMSMKIRVIAFSKYAPVLLRRKLRVVVKMRCRKLNFAGQQNHMHSAIFL